jgi:hypothetical protein
VTQDQIRIFRLIKRSRPNVDGWYDINELVWPLFVYANMPKELIETAETKIRLTHEGKIVMKYLF